MEGNEPTSATTPLDRSIRGDDQIVNDANCYVFKMTDIERLERFIFAGTVPRQLAAINDILQGLFRVSRGLEVVQMIYKISIHRRNARQDALIYAYAFCCRRSNDEVKLMAYSHLNNICRIPTDLFMFIKYCEDISRPGTGWGRAHRRAVSRWYRQFENNPERLFHLVTKYKRRSGISHVDVIRLAHVKSADPVIQLILRYIIKGYTEAKELFTDVTTQTMVNITNLMSALDDAKRTDNPENLCNLIRAHRLTWEQCPTRLLKNRSVLMCLLQQMPIEATVRKLGLMTCHTVFDDADGEESLRLVVQKLDSINTDFEDHVEDVRGGPRKVWHPLKLYKARTQYMKDRAHDKEQSARRSTLWKPIQRIGDALERAFYRSFSKMQPTGKRIYFVHSVSDRTIKLGDWKLPVNEISAVMSVTLARTEENCVIAAIGGNKMEILDVDRNEKMDSVLTRLNSLHLPGEADWSLPIKDAMERKLRDIDAFLFYVDCENAYTETHVADDMVKYRQYCNNPSVKLIVCGLNDSPHSLADKDDVHMLNISVFDASVPKLIDNFIRREMRGVRPDAILAELPGAQIIGGPDDMSDEMQGVISGESQVDLPGEQNTENPDDVEMTDDETSVELSAARSNDVELDRRVKTEPTQKKQ
ncbi:RNA-binding protein RO60-like isoform X1 [Dreissena polymorpha]|uniref:RNA-binding protein RO60-like isoform X1 n=2 Tax=Dreissena polymorpha TaxID=45954 RepID=UPI002264C2BA|nr:RNA-binding protein RO60-like isoform X1 [Dreissena polymorpha]